MNEKGAYKQLLKLVRNTARCYVDNDYDLDDTAQEALISLIKHARRQLPYTYVQRTAQRTAINYLRKRQKESRFTDPAFYLDTSGEIRNIHDDTLVAVPVIAPAPEPDLPSLIGKALAGIPYLQRQALLLYAEGFSYKEISDLQEANIGTVRSRIHYARRHAQQELMPLVSES